jgi:predicted GTPase
MARRRVVILGAAGRDFHNFNIYYRERENYEIVCFTATQIPGIDDKMYPPVLSGPLYPDGIPIRSEKDLQKIIVDEKIDAAVFAYSDLSHEQVMQIGSRCLAAGADFEILCPENTQYVSNKPVIAVVAVRTGAGKSQTSRRVAEILKSMGKKIAVIRHPMPYGVLADQICQRFATYEDLDKHKCTIEEREEYEPHIDEGNIVFAGVDFGVILAEAEKEADVILWDGGNNDCSFYKPDLNICVADPHRPGHEMTYTPGEVNFQMADVIIINKVDTATWEGVDEVKGNAHMFNPTATVIEADSPVVCDDPSLVKGKRVLVIEDGPTVTHGGMPYGAGIMAVNELDAAEIIDPRPYAVGSIKDIYDKYPHLTDILPAMGYGDKQVAELQETINAADCDTVVIGTPIDIRRVIDIKPPKQSVRVRYSLKERTKPDLEDIIKGMKL